MKRFGIASNGPTVENADPTITTVPFSDEAVNDKAVEIARVYEICAAGNVDQITAEIQKLNAADRLRSPMSFALRSAKAVASADVPSAIALLQRGIELPPSVATPFLVDLLVPLLVSTTRFSEAEAYLDRYSDMFEGDLIASREAARSVIAARLGDDRQSRVCAEAALRMGRTLESTFLSARITSRVALAAFHREDFDDAQDRSLEAARAFERVGAFRSAANSYILLYVIANDWIGDADIARFYAERATISGKRAANLTLEIQGLCAQLGIAAESGDTRRLGSLRARVLANQRSEQFNEKFAWNTSEILYLGWSGRFETVTAMLKMLRSADSRSTSERALCSALLATATVAEWNLDEARKYIRSAISQSSEVSAHEALYERRYRLLARIIAAAACFLIGDGSRGRRALGRSFDPNGTFASILSADGIIEDQSPRLMRGYARFVNAAVEAAKARRPGFALTPTELAILRALPEGRTLEAIAADFQKSRKTIERHVGSIYQKLEVSNRAQAIRRARELGIFA